MIVRVSRAGPVGISEEYEIALSKLSKPERNTIEQSLIIIKERENDKFENYSNLDNSSCMIMEFEGDRTDDESEPIWYFHFYDKNNDELTKACKAVFTLIKNFGVPFPSQRQRKL